MGINIYQGERNLVKDNFLLGEFNMTGLPPLPSGEAKINVIMNMDTNGILHVTAIDKSDPNNSKDIVIKNDKNRFSQ